VNSEEVGHYGRLPFLASLVSGSNPPHHPRFTMVKKLSLIGLSAVCWTGGYIHKGIGSSDQNRNLAQTTPSPREDHQRPSFLFGATKDSHDVTTLLANLAPEDQINLGNYYLRAIKIDILRELGRTNPEEAIRHFADLEPGQNRSDLGVVILSHWATQDPVSALSWYEENLSILTDSEKKNYPAFIFHQFALKDPGAAEEAAKGYDNPRVQMDLALGLGEAWGNRSSEEAFRSFESFATRCTSAEILTECYARLMQGQIRNNPTTAAAAINDLETSALKTRLVEDVVGPLMKKDPAEATQWIAGLGDKRSQSFAVEAVLRQSDFDQIINFTSNLPATGFDSHQVESIFSFAANQDPAKALELAASIPHELKPHAVKESVFRWCLDDPQKAAHWISEQAMGAEFDAAVGGVAKAIRNNYNPDILKWTSQVGSEQQRQDYVQEIAHNMPAESLGDLKMILPSLNLAPEIVTEVEQTISQRSLVNFQELVLPE